MSTIYLDRLVPHGKTFADLQFKLSTDYLGEFYTEDDLEQTVKLRFIRESVCVQDFTQLTFTTT